MQAASQSALHVQIQTAHGYGTGQIQSVLLWKLAVNFETQKKELIYKQADAQTVNTAYFGYHTLDVEMAIDRLKKWQNDMKREQEE